MTKMYEISANGVIKLDSMKSAKADKVREMDVGYKKQFEEFLKHVCNKMLNGCHLESLSITEDEAGLIVDQYQRAMGDLAQILKGEDYNIEVSLYKFGIESIEISGW